MIIQISHKQNLNQNTQIAISWGILYYLVKSVIKP